MAAEDWVADGEDFERCASGSTASCLEEEETFVPEWSSLEDFHLRKKLGSTALSTVYLAECKRTGIAVAIKVYRKEALSYSYLSQAYREIRCLQACSGHTNVNRLLGWFENNEKLVMVLEHCSGGDLYWLKSKCGGVLPEGTVGREVVRPLLSALQHIHSQGVIHRDVKPENLFLDGNGNVQLGDFGLAIDVHRAKPRAIVGTLDYIAPELLLLTPADDVKGVELDGPSPYPVGYSSSIDIWSAGVLAYELLVGRPPFELPGTRDTKIAILTHSIRPAAGWPAHLSPECISFLEAALTKDPSMRPSISALLCHPWLNRSSSASPAAAASPKTQTKWMPPSPISVLDSFPSSSSSGSSSPAYSPLQSPCGSGTFRQESMKLEDSQPAQSLAGQVRNKFMAWVR